MSDEIDASPRTDRPSPRPETQFARLQRLVNRVTLRSQWPMRMSLAVEFVELGDALRVVIKMRVKDIHSAEDINVYSAEQFDHEYLMAHRDDYIVRAICALVKRAVMHELDECLLVDGKQVHDPHVVKGVARL